MAAVISGNGLGLFNSSASQIGMGLGGGARLGQGQDNQFVNVATGNLLLQSQDDQVLFRGMLVGFNRTYNSRGQLSQVGADAWLTGFERRVELLSGTFNTAGSVMRRHTGDGSYQDFTFVSAGVYSSSTGEGAHDRLSWDAGSSTWSYVEGSTRQEERYADHASATLKGRLTQLRDLRTDGAQPLAWDVSYDANGRVSSVATAVVDYDRRFVFAYDAQGRLSGVTSKLNNVAIGQTWYEYDAAGRLASVLVDLTPGVVTTGGSTPDHDQWTAAAGSNDGYLFKTTYTYTDATSLLISRVEQSDGSVTSYTYDAQNRVKTVTRGDTNNNDGDGLGQTLTFSYDSATTTSVTDSAGRMWAYIYDASGQLTEVRQPAVDGLRETTTYAYDAAGNVTRVSTQNGGLVLSQTDYAYDANGNVTWQWDRVQGGSNASARAVQRTYTGNNQLASETVYTGLDSDGAAAGAMPSGGLTTRYLYDAQDRLRFVIDAAGAVREVEYYTSGTGIGRMSKSRQYLGEAYSGAYTTADLAAWATTARKANSTLTDYTYSGVEARGDRSYASVDANGNGIESDADVIEGYRYDEHGRVLIKNHTSPEGSYQTWYSYDGLGRVLSEKVLEKGTVIQSRTWVYQDSQRLSHTIIEGGVVGDNDQSNDRIRSEQRDAAGRLVYVKESAVSGTSGGVRESRNYYDSTGRLRASENSGGARTYFFYDAEGQLSGQVDETGAVTEYLRDELGRVTATKRYATKVNPASWAQSGGGGGGGGGGAGNGAVTDPNRDPRAGMPVPPRGDIESMSFRPEESQLSALGTGMPVNGIFVYDLIADARPTSSADDRITSTSYDALGRVITQTDAEGAITTYSYDGANRLLQTRTTDAAGTAATARVTRYFYDAQGRETGRLDAEGYLTEHSYDLAGRRIRSVAYATVTPAAQQASGALNDLRPATSGNDQTTRWFYDGRGNLVATLNAEGYLTEFVHDARRLQVSTKAYALKLGGLSGNETLATLRASAAAGAVRESRRSFDSLGRVIAEQNPEGTVTRYSYDAQGNLVRSEVAADTTDVREGRMRYNVFGELIGELHGEGAARVLPGMTEAQLDALYAQYGVRHSYNSLGQRSESIDAAGNKTWYFYDASGRPTFVVKGVADASGVANAQGEVIETRYNAFGEAIETTAYTGRITLATAGSRDSVATAITTLAYVAASDSRRSVSYNHRGQVIGSVNAENAATRYTYNAFGERIREVSAFGAPTALTVETDYDRRGLATARREGVGSAVARAQGWTYDAFGRVTTAVDARGIATTYSYDRLGRQLTASQTVMGRQELVSTSYDAYGRVLSVTDALGRTTTSAYDTANRTTTVTTPEGVTVVTTFNRHGQQVNVATPLPGGTFANTSYLYDRDGNLKSTTDALGRADSNEYDVRGLLSATVDRTGRRVELRYDAVGRLLQRIEDPAGLALATTYRYDGQGRLSEVTDASGRKTAYSYDREGRLTQVAADPAGLNLRTVYTYDALGRQITVTEGAGTAQARTIQYDYDALGRRTAERLDPAGLNLITSYAYDANDNVVRRTDATGNVTRFYYDEADRMIYTIDPLGVMTRNWFDVTGKVVATRTFIAATNASTLTDTTTIAQLDARLAWGSTDPGSYTVYDRDGRARLVLSTIGTIQEFTYDAAGRVSVIRNYAALWPDFGTTMLNKLFAGTAQLSDFNLDALRNDTATDRVRDLVTYQVFTVLGELRTTVDNAGTVISYVYDAAGRQTVHKRYAHAAQLNPTLRAKLVAGTASPQDVVDVVAVFNETDLVTYTSYDGAGRARYTVDGNGSVVEILYDSAGRPVGTRAYATAIVVNTDATFKSQLIAGDPAAMGMVRDRVAAIANDARDLRSYQVYDSAGRIAATIDGAGYVSTRSYDAAGRVVQERRHAQAATIAAPLLAKLIAGTASVADIAAVTPVNNAADAVVRHIYDAAGRERYTLTQNSGSTYLVSERRYDGASRVVAQYQYSVPIALGPVATPAQVGAALNAAGAYNTADLYRSTQYVFDAAGRVRFTVDDLGAVNEQRYDGAGRVLESRRYGSTISISIPMNEAAIAAAVSGIADVRKTTTAYDAMGRVVTVTDALNQYEAYTYNALGQLTALRNKNGHVWNYEYDAAGRRTAEISPEVGIGSADVGGAQSYRVGRIVTRTAYDALGNVVSRTENADTNQARVTRYEYDNRGNQIRTIFPDAGKIDPVSKQLVATGIQPTADVGYDALGRAVVSKDVRGFYSYKVYDNLGRLAYDVDQENYVTAYAYDGFGQQTHLRRYAQKLNVGALGGWSEGQPLSMAQMQAATAAFAADRTITTRYDQRGLAVQIEQTQVAYFTSTGASAVGSPTVRVEYDGFGNKVKESILLEGTPGQADARWADTYTYYDLVGRVVMTVDAEGHVTRTGYSVTGEPVETIEYAKAISTGSLNTRTPPALPPLGDAISGYDRVTRWTYDALGRKASETMVRHFQGRDGSSGVRDVATQFRYDGEDRVTQIINDTGTTATVYDALGRVLNVTEPMRKVINDGTFGMLAQNTGYDLNHPHVYADVSPFTEMMYDAFGNLLRTWKHVSGKRSDGSFDSDPNKDQIEWIRYDWQGRAVGTTVSNGDTTYTDYDAADNVTHRWYSLSGADSSRDVHVHSWYSFDKAGRQTGMSQTRNRISDGAQSVDLAQQATYNAFGEIIEKSFLGVAGTHNYNYDAAGRLLSNNEAYGTRNFGYNLAGHQVRESHIVATSEGQTVEAVSWNTTDRLGRTTLTRLPSHTADPAMTSTVQQRLDRWGNVLEVIDARGFRTNYRYNELNQVTRDERPLVVVVPENGVGVWQRPVNEWFYDAQGRLLATRDANGSVRNNDYDAVGRLIASRDGLGQATLFAYDAMGNQRITQNPLGYLTYKDYDRQGRLIEIGDYLVNGAGRSRASLQRYVLNQNGDRLQVFDALNNRSLYDYNSDHQVLRSQTATGVWTSYTYDVMGNKTGESTALSGATFQDRDGELVNKNELTWNYDAYGRLIDHNNLSGRDFDYYYQGTTGQLASETQSGGPAADAVRHTVYYPNGKIKAIYENSVAPRYRYEYDASGNRTLEEVNTVDGGGLTVRTITRTVYDSHNRIQRVTQDDLSSGVSKRVFDLSYSYDAVGNRRSVVARSGYGPAADGVPVDGNNAPTLLQGIPWHSVRPGTIGEFSVVFSEYFRDPEQDPLSVRIDLVGGGALPSWLTVQRDPGGNLITFIARPDANVPVQDLQIRMTAYETANPSAATEATFVLFVRNNVEPRLHNTNTETLLVKTGLAWSKDLFAADFFYDLDIGDQMRLSVVNAASLPAWLQLDTSSPGALRLRGVPQSGTYTLQLRVTDQLGWESQIKTVQLVVAPNHAPSGPSPLPAKAIPVDRDFLWSMPVSEVFFDADGDGLEIRASGLPSWLTFQRTTVQGVSQLRLVGRPPEGMEFGIVYNVAFTATDPDGATRTATLTLTTRAGNQRPTAPQFTFAATGVLGLAYSFQLPAFQDGDGDALTYRATNLPPGLSFDPATRMLFGTPSQLGEYEFKYTATDGMGGITTVPVRLFVRGNTAPVAPTVPAQSVMATTGWNYALPWFTDADGDLAMYTITGLPPGVGYDADTKTMSGAPTTPGTYTITVQAFDQWGASTATQFTLTVTPRPPENLAPYVNRQADGAYFIVVIDEPGIPPLQRYYMPADTFRDPDGNPLTYSVIAPPDWGVGIFHTGELFVEGRPYAGVENYEYGMEFRLRATDSHGAYVDMVFGATVKTVRNGGGGGPGFPQDPASLPGGGEQAALVFDMGQAHGAAVAANQDGVDSLQPVSAQAAVSSAAAGNAPVEATTYWFVYDAENRIKINNGDLVNGQILVSRRNPDSYEVMYDAGGNVAARAIAIGDDVRLERYSYDLRGNRVLEFHPLTLRGGEVANNYEGVSKQLFYDANNRLKEVRQYYGASAMFVHRQRENEVDEIYGFYPYGGWLFYGERYDYDADGRMLYQETWQRPQYADESWVMTVYGDAQRQMEDLTVLQRRSRTENAGGYDVGGRLSSYRYTGLADNNSEYTHYYNVVFQGWETYQHESVTGTSSNHNYRTTTNTLTYDPFGHLMSQRENTPLRNGSLDDRMRYYAYNGDGRVLTRREGSLNSSGQFVQPGDQGPSNYMLVHAAGQQLAELRQGSSANFNNTTYFTKQIQSLNGLGNYDAGDGSSVPVQAGDTLRKLAVRIYGSDALWYVLAQANGLGNPDQELAAGTLITAPSTRVSGNDSNTFKPYNPAEAIGSTTPNLPYIPPPPKNACGAIAMVIMVVVAVVVTVFTAGAAGPAVGGLWTSGMAALTGTTGLAGIGAAALGGFVGSVASQAVGSAMGVASFSWKSAFVSGATAAATAGFGALVGQSATMGRIFAEGSMARAAAAGVVGSLANYGANKLVGNDVSFSWRGVAAAALSSVVSNRIGKAFNLNEEAATGMGQFGKDLADNAIGGVVGLHTRRAFGFNDDINYGNIAADAFGNALASAIGTSGSRRQQRLDDAMNRSMQRIGRDITQRLEIKTAQDLKLDETARMAEARMRGTLNVALSVQEIGARAEQNAEVSALIERGFDRSVAATEARLRAEAAARAAATRLAIASSQPVSNGPSWRNGYGAPAKSDPGNFRMLGAIDSPARAPKNHVFSGGVPIERGIQRLRDSINKDFPAAISFPLGMLFGVGREAIDMAAGTAELVVNALGANAYLLTGGYVGEKQFDAMAGMQSGMADLGLAMAKFSASTWTLGLLGDRSQLLTYADKAGAAVSRWYDRTMDAYNGDRMFDYGMEVSGAATKIATAIEGGAFVASKAGIVSSRTFSLGRTLDEIDGVASYQSSPWYSEIDYELDSVAGKRLTALENMETWGEVGDIAASGRLVELPSSIEELRSYYDRDNPRAGDFSDGTGKSLIFLMSRVPDNAVRLPFHKVANGSDFGVNFRWASGADKTERFRAHSQDGNVKDPAANSAMGWTFRHQKNRGFYDPTTNSFRHHQVHNPNSTINYDPAAANNTHIPMNTPPKWLIDLLR
ncbi:putative Ig domain-containing protein [Lysobacter capsici]|uniref:putative Ig domain-containing protein n=1 Tax=Lysobacter capsici TaxID=435897 RepID=UPI000BBAC332|nr:putative Ig domain-containing protein [Lysobacter capsici]ATE70871.1 hypothetical protein CNO08_05525 [Lysobacter capsici]